MPRKTKNVRAEAPPAPFDRLKRNGDEDCYQVKVLERGQKITIRIAVETKEEIEQTLPAAIRFWQSRARWFKAFQQYAVDELLPALNESLESDEAPPVSASRLKTILKAPFSVDFYRDDDDGSVTFVISGGNDDALGENCFEATGNLEDGITEGDVVSLM